MDTQMSVDCHRHIGKVFSRSQFRFCTEKWDSIVDKYLLCCGALRLFTGFTTSAKFLWENGKSRGLRSSALSVNDVVSEIPRIGKLPERNPLGTHARDSRFETLKNAGEMSCSSSTVHFSSKLPRPSRSILSRAVVNWRGDFPNGFLFDRPVNNARGKIAKPCRIDIARTRNSNGLSYSHAFSWRKIPVGSI